MGTYILNSGEHPARGKAQTLLVMGATEVGQAPPSFDEIPADKELICVVYNGSWEAAGVAEDEHELWRFKADATGRLKRWFLLDKQTVREMIEQGRRE